MLSKLRSIMGSGQGENGRKKAHGYDVGPFMCLLVVVLLGEEGDDGLGQEDLVVLVVREAAPHHREHEHPEVVRHVVFMQHHLA